jgi:hypothetical protein
VRWKSGRGAIRARVGNRLRRVAGKVALRPLHDLFAEEWLQRKRQRDLVADHVVDGAASRRRRVTQPTDLDRGGPPAEDADAAGRREAGQIDGDVDFQSAHAAGDALVALLPYVVKPIERSDEPFTHVARILGPVRNANDLEAVAVVLLEQLCGEEAHGVRPEIGRHIGEPDFLV